MRERLTATGLFVVANRHGDVVMAAPALTKRRAWANVRTTFGAYETMMLRRRGYAAVPCTITYDPRSELTWQTN
jgi:hypothetical protein